MVHVVFQNGVIGTEVSVNHSHTNTWQHFMIYQSQTQIGCLALFRWSSRNILGQFSAVYMKEKHQRSRNSCQDHLLRLVNEGAQEGNRPATARFLYGVFQTYDQFTSHNIWKNCNNQASSSSPRKGGENPFLSQNILCHNIHCG